MEWKLFGGDVPYVSTYDYHKDRPRAPHAEQEHHKGRMALALEYVTHAANPNSGVVVDLGCGDGGFIQMLSDLWPSWDIYGFDFQPTNADGWNDRGVTDKCRSLDVFPLPPGPALHPEVAKVVARADVTVATEVLEHIARPHEVLRAITSSYVVASSPWNESKNNHDESHAWAWDMAGYLRMFEDAGYDIREHQRAGLSQVILAKRRG